MDIPKNAEGKIVFSDVSFGYRKEPVLEETRGIQSRVIIEIRQKSYGK